MNSEGTLVAEHETRLAAEAAAAAAAAESHVSAAELASRGGADDDARAVLKGQMQRGLTLLQRTLRGEARRPAPVGVDGLPNTSVLREQMLDHDKVRPHPDPDPNPTPTPTPNPNPNPNPNPKQMLHHDKVKPNRTAYCLLLTAVLLAT